jgi:hypothetical protein
VVLEVETECAHCGDRLNIELTSELSFDVRQAQAKPIVFAPMVNFEKLAAPTIIDDF